MTDRNDNLIAYIFLLPALIIFAIFFVYPNLEIIYLSFFNWMGISPQKIFIGLQNYINLLTDGNFYQAVMNTTIIAAQSILIQIPIALILGILLNKSLKATGLFATIIFLPIVISRVAVSIIWMWMYDPDFGALNMFLGNIGLGNWQRAWLGEIPFALIAVIVVIDWIYIGLYTVIFRSALKGIPQAIFDAAKVDGFDEFKTTLKIRIPLLKEVIGVMIIMCISGSFKSFDLIWVMTGGGPVGSTEIATTYLFRMAFRRMQSGYASAIGVMIFVICLILIISQLKIMKIKPDERGK